MMIVINYEGKEFIAQPPKPKQPDVLPAVYEDDKVKITGYFGYNREKEEFHCIRLEGETKYVPLY